MECRFKELCKKHYHVTTADDCSHEKSLECPIADKIQDILMDARDIMEEQLPFTDDYDGPVEEEEI